MVKPQTLAPALEYPTISREEILGRLRDRALVIVNVMAPDSFNAAHIPGSINLPVADVEAKAPRILSNLAQEIVVYCAGPT